jgi:uncharacterized ParB-like nuclease family protein
MRELIADDFVAGSRMQANANLVGHRARRAEQCSLHSEQLGRGALELVDGLVVAVHVVANLGGKHRLQHRLGRARHGIAADINYLVNYLGHCGSLHCSQQ